MKKSKQFMGRRQPGDPHVPHTTQFQRRDDLESIIPEAAMKVINSRWPAIQHAAQYDAETMMLEIYRITRDACKAAGWPDSMAYQMRDYILGKVNDAKIRTFQGGELRDFRIGEASQRMVKYLDPKTRKVRMVPWVSRDKPKEQPPQRPTESRGQQLAAFLLEDGETIPYEKVYGKKIRLINPHGREVLAKVTGYVGAENGVVFQIQNVPEWPLPGDNQTERQLRQQGWIIPKITVTDVRDQEIKRLAGEMFASENPPNPS